MKEMDTIYRHDLESEADNYRRQAATIEDLVECLPRDLKIALLTALLERAERPEPEPVIGAFDAVILCAIGPVPKTIDAIARDAGCLLESEDIQFSLTRLASAGKISRSANGLWRRI